MPRENLGERVGLRLETELMPTSTSGSSPTGRKSSPSAPDVDVREGRIGVLVFTLLKNGPDRDR